MNSGKPKNAILLCILLGLGSVLGLSGIDLVLPSIPALPEILGGNQTRSQLVIAAFIGGTAFGILFSGYIGSKIKTSSLLFSSLTLYALVSFLCSLSESLDVLIVLRFFQGLCSSAPAVLAPGIVKNLFDEKGATRVLGMLGSVESLVPALAPILGVWLLTFGTWKYSFLITAFFSLFLAFAFLFLRIESPRPVSAKVDTGSYRQLLRSPVFQRYSLSQALNLGGLLVFVFGAPVIIVKTMNSDISKFAQMQTIGVVFFITGAISSSFLNRKFEPESLVTIGTFLSLFSSILLLLYSIFGNNNPNWILAIFPLMNLGLGLRGPTGFLKGILASNGDDNRASSLILLSIISVSSLGTAFIAPFLHFGLFSLSLFVVFLHVGAGLSLLFLPKLTSD
ncbi:MFS transporter [Leptospira gomenensis]|uniref:MFS transporter n=1 Tax=Leptospira gomenensis TaxID=2484974 RepID=A0A5F1Y6J3_9LEPT|nr:MFS transporter [Leptospira gomenensis]TGK27557.1 MFS transporter [Leptospira gomenensis]TGK38231.1 MFS transporter [Leptospira gomenensis]TGK42638.1 MFS transporter [Leptospira gomenensis]TGK65801.1 MFS transporter [Leptospira gomenensis]